MTQKSFGILLRYQTTEVEKNEEKFIVFYFN
jgi:hypothetical protein